MVSQTAADPRAAIRDEARRIASANTVNPEAIFRVGAAALELGLAPEADAMFAAAVRVLRHVIGRRDAPRV